MKTDTPTPRTDKAEFSFDTFNGVDPWEGERWIKVVPSKISAKLETELTAALEASTQWEAEAWRSDELLEQRDNELTAAREEIERLKDHCRIKVKALINQTSERMKAEQQRDRLAEALEQLMSYQPRSTVMAMNERHVWSNAKEALQSLTLKTNESI